MKKFMLLFALVAFVGTASFAQTTTKEKAKKTEQSCTHAKSKAECTHAQAKAACTHTDGAKSACTHANGKECTAEERAACEKAGKDCSKGKAGCSKAAQGASSANGARAATNTKGACCAKGAAKSNANCSGKTRQSCHGTAKEKSSK